MGKATHSLGKHFLCEVRVLLVDASIPALDVDVSPNSQDSLEYRGHRVFGCLFPT